MSVQGVHRGWVKRSVRIRRPTSGSTNRWHFWREAYIHDSSPTPEPVSNSAKSVTPADLISDAARLGGAARSRLLGRWSWNPWLCAILAAGFAARLSLAMRLNYFADEVFSVRAALLGPGQAWRAALGDMHPPLYDFLLSFWLAEVGAWPEWRARLLSILIGIAWAVVIHRIAARHLSRRGALLAAAIVSLHPFAVQFTEPLRWYGLFALLVTLVVDRLELVLTGNRFSDRVALSMFLIAAGWTHVFGIVLACLTLALLAVRRVRGAAPVFVLTVVGLLPTLHWLLADLSPLQHAIFDRTALKVGLLTKPLLLAVSVTAGAASYPTDPPTLTCLLALAIALPVALARRRLEIRAVPAVISWIPALCIPALVLTPYSAPHYYLVLLAPVALCVAWLTDRWDTVSAVVVTAFVAAAATGLVHLLTLRQMVRAEFTDPWGEVAATALAAVGEEGLILTNSEVLCFYLGDIPRCATVWDAGALDSLLTRAAATRVVVVSAPQSGAREDAFDLERTFPSGLKQRGYRLVRDTGLVRTDAAELRRKFSRRPFPEFRVRMLEFLR